jgi:hypothetical protein
MTVLISVTLAYAAILVLALAASLTAILVRLRRIDRALDRTRRALLRVRSGTEPLALHFEPIEQRLGAAIRSYKEAADDLSKATRPAAAAGAGSES